MFSLERYCLDVQPFEDAANEEKNEENGPNSNRKMIGKKLMKFSNGFIPAYLSERRLFGMCFALINDEY